MLKHNDIIAKLTDSQKIRLLTNIDELSEKDMKILGLPALHVGRMKDYLRNIYPHATALSNSWSRALWMDVSSDILASMASERINFAITPGAKIKLSPYRRELSEDPRLASAMAGCYLSSAKNAGISAAPSGYYLTESDAEWMDREPNVRVINEFLVKPYIDSVNQGGALAVVADNRVPSESYSGVNRDIQSSISDDGRLLVCDMLQDEDTVGFVARGGFAVQGSAVALENALKRYKKLKNSLDRGVIEASELDYEINNHTAIAPETLDLAVDNLLELAYSSDVRSDIEPRQEQERLALAERAVTESTVLLKNEGGILPLKEGVSIAYIGDIAISESSLGRGVIEKCSKYLESMGHECVGIAPGYSFESETDNSTLRDALELSRDADIVVLFLGNGYEREKRLPQFERLTIPANQLYLADKLSKQGKRVVAVLDSGHAPDVEFASLFAGLIFTPLETCVSGEALAKMLVGETVPSGKLASTLYSGSLTGLAKQKVYRNKWNMKTGPFVGYRYYDTAGMNVGYPFGYGLSYAEFEYSGLRVDNLCATVKVKNVGAYKGRETVQFYMGIDSSSVLRPRKELAAFTCVELLPGEEKTVKLNLTPPTVYADGRYVCESGIYTVYVGAGVSDERLSCRATVAGASLSPDGERRSDYLQTVSNIVEDKYTLEADYEPMKKSVKNILFGLGSVALAISIAVFNSLSATSSVFLGSVAGILGVVAIVFFALEIAERNRLYKEERRIVEEKNDEHFKDAEEISGLNSERMFIDEFDTADDDGHSSSSANTDELSEEYFMYVDKSFGFADAAKEFAVFAEERGCKLARGVAENIFAAMASSRLIVVENVKDFQGFVLLLAEYFDTTAYIDIVNETYCNEHNAFFGYNEHGEIIKKNAVFAMESAKKDKMNIHFSALDGVKCDGVMDYFAPFVKYIKNPTASSEISAPNGRGGEAGFIVPGNLWFVLNLAEGERADMLPDNLLKLASTLKIDYSMCPLAREHEVIRKFKYYQLDYLTDKVRASSSVPEEIWKKIDRLESYAKAIGDYSIGNKLWLMLEIYTGVLLNCGTELPLAVDSAVASKLLMSVCNATNGKITEDDRSLAETLDFIFGEENINLCRDVLKARGLA